MSVTLKVIVVLAGVAIIASLLFPWGVYHGIGTVGGFWNVGHIFWGKIAIQVCSIVIFAGLLAVILCGPQKKDGQ
jgi:uncharacterized membrane protein